MQQQEQEGQYPPPKVLVRSKKQLELYTLDGASTDSITLLHDVSTSLQTISKDGSFALVHIANYGVVKVELKNPVASTTKPPVFLKDSEGVQMMDISSGCSFILTWERYYADKCPRNLRVWDAVSGKLLAGFPQKNISSSAWPYVQWSGDEKYAFLMTATQIRLYERESIAKHEAAETEDPRFLSKVQIPCATLSVPQVPQNGGTPYYITAFSGKSKDKPAVATVFELKDQQFERVASKSLFQAEECVTQWNPTGTACLINLQTAVDTTGQSYYGNARLWLWNSVNIAEVVSVPLPQEGPVQAMQWLPHPEKPPSFVVIAGRMPAMASQHHGVTSAVTFLFGNNVHRNTVASSPHARFLCLGGFGNLAGGMGFWDTNKKKLLPHDSANASGVLQAAATVTMHSWSPDSRWFLVATTAPRMNVDNGITLYRYTGQLVSKLPWDNTKYRPNHLLEACFVPAPLESYPDRPQSPPPETPTSTSASSASATPAPAGKPPGRYVPPGARSRGGNSLADRIRQEKQGSLQGATKVSKQQPVVGAAAQKALPVGMAAAPAPGGKSKSQLKREKLKKKKELEEQQRKEEEEKAAAAPPPTEPVDPAKRARKVKKILKQIDELKAKGGELNEDQKAKLDSEAELRAELAQLEV